MLPRRGRRRRLTPIRAHHASNHRKRTYTVAPLGFLRFGWPLDFVRALAD